MVSEVSIELTTTSSQTMHSTTELLGDFGQTIRLNSYQPGLKPSILSIELRLPLYYWPAEQDSNL